MADIGVSIVKRTAFRLSTQEFSNHYYYRRAGGLPDGAAAEAIIDELVLTEKALHSNLVTFVVGRLWSAGGTPAQNVMIKERPLSGTGTQSVIGGLDPERAVLCRFPAGIDIRGRPVYFRKWYHSCGVCNGVIFTVNQMSQQAAIPTADKTTIQNKVNEVIAVGATADWQLMAPSGRQLVSGGQAQCHDFLEHRQFGDQWRG